MSRIVIVGAGLAGLFTALKLGPRAVTVIAPAPLGEGASSAWAQGGIAAAVGAGDSPEQHAEDTIRAGAGIVDVDVAHMVAREGGDRVRDLLAYGVPFDRDLEGHFVLSREAAHSQKRVVRVTGDRAGQAIMAALIAAVDRTPSVRIMEGWGAEDLTSAGGRVTGLVLARADDVEAPLLHMSAEAVVLATGGIGGLYAVTTNPPSARGEAIAMAARAGAVVADTEFVQFHPTAIDAGLDPAPLATEALRGEGAVLINRAGERFMPAQHPDAELGPRDIVARGVFREIAAGRGAFLDCRDAIGNRFPDAFPTVYARCRDAGLDPVHEPIPVAPAEHYHMGGIAADARARTTVAGLWAVGEAASTGLHGANRLASNSLLEAVVFGARAAEDIAATVTCGSGNRLEPQHCTRRRRINLAERAALTAEIRETMAREVGVERSAEGLAAAIAVLERIRRSPSVDPQIANMALTAHLIATAALRRTESRGSHFRRDFPQSDAAQARRSLLRNLP
ncbi:MAG: L-aspartate oxidase [Hyphomicrobiaceae bacterium]